VDTGARGDLNQSRFWHETQMAECTAISDFFAPLEVFIDYPQVDMYGKVNVEPFMFTGDWFNHEVCTKAQSWRPLGFIAHTKVKSSAQNATSKFTTQDYQSALNMILHDVAAVHAAGGFKHTFKLAGKSFLVTIKCPIAVIIGDAKGNNMLCAHYNSSKSKLICQECDIPFTETDDSHFPCHWVTQQQVQELYLDIDRKGVEDLCFHFIDNAFWNISFVAN
jgi:hypothetical protein